MIKKKTTLGFLCLMALALVACSHQQVGNLTLNSNQPALKTMETIMQNVQKCWFNANNKDFTSYLLAPELQSFSNRPRILLVLKNTPSEKPVLVIEASGDKAKVLAYGPMMNSSLSNKIAKNLKNWTNGNSKCQ